MRYDLPPADIAEIDALTAAATASTTTTTNDTFSRTCAALFATVDEAHGRTGVFWCCVALIRAGVGGATVRNPGDLHVSGISDTGGRVQPPPPGLGEMMTAVFDADTFGTPWAAAAATFDTAVPPTPVLGRCPRMRAVAYFLFTVAVMRSDGLPVKTQYRPGTVWPPPCDLCTGETAALMYGCEPFEPICYIDRDTGWTRTVGFTDEEIRTWYLCTDCGADVEANTWARIRNRRLILHGHPVYTEIAQIWNGFRINRTGPGTPIPATRPTSREGSVA